jgi:SAM-dependent methyltransferase
VEHLEKLSNCPVCGGTAFKDTLQATDHTVSLEQFNIVSCESCGFMFTNPRPSKEQIGRYYQSSAYISHSDTSKGLVNKLYKFARTLTLASKYRLIKPYLGNQKLLDIGAGTGYFLKYCSDKGIMAEGVEPDADARALADKQHRLRLNGEEYLEKYPDENFSVITMWHVLEHVHDLNNRILEIRRLLKQDGRLFVAVPNHNSADAHHYKAFWAAYDVPRHLYHFDPESIQKLFEKHGFVLDAILPMYLDAFYISLLSEKYKIGKTSFFKAFFQGLLSNLQAGTGKYSSQIYVLSKR